MLPGVGFQEMVLIAIVAIVIVGPKDLPLMLRKFGKWVNRMRSMARDFQSSFEELARQAELDELRKEVEALRRDTTRDLNTLKNAAHIDESIFDAPAKTAPVKVEPEPEPANAADALGVPAEQPAEPAPLESPHTLAPVEKHGEAAAEPR
jgi:sec-independent protein translocase protein TatB